MCRIRLQARCWQAKSKPDQNVGIRNLDVSPSAQAQVNRVQHRGFVAVARTDQAINVQWAERSGVE